MEHERCPERHLVDRHFRGRISPAKEQHMRQHLPTCAVCRARYERHLLNSQLAGGLEPADRLAIGLGLRRVSAPIWRLASAPWSMLSLAAAAAVGLFLLGARSRDRADERLSQEFTARGGASSSTPAADPSLQVFRVDARGVQAPVGGFIRAADELAFAYRNPTGFRNLAVFGADESGHIYWYHPARRDPKDDPVVVSIEKSDYRELPEAIRHDYHGSRLRIVALFLNQPVSTGIIEKHVRKGDLALAELGNLQKVEKTLEIRR